jgi:hypothetical protein
MRMAKARKKLRKKEVSIEVYEGRQATLKDGKFEQHKAG